MLIIQSPSSVRTRALSLSLALTRSLLLSLFRSSTCSRSEFAVTHRTRTHCKLTRIHTHLYQKTPAFWRGFALIDRGPADVNGANAQPTSRDAAVAKGGATGASKPGQWTMEDTTTFSKKCDPYEQGGKPLDPAHALALMDTVDKSWKLSEDSKTLSCEWQVLVCRFDAYVRTYVIHRYMHGNMSCESQVRVSVSTPGFACIYSSALLHVCRVAPRVCALCLCLCLCLYLCLCRCLCLRSLSQNGVSAGIGNCNFVLTFTVTPPLRCFPRRYISTTVSTLLTHIFLDTDAGSGIGSRVCAAHCSDFKE